MSQVKGGENNMDEEIQAAEGDLQAPEEVQGDVNTEQESQPDEQTAEDTEQVESTEETEAVETESEPKKGAQSRIKELVKERNEEREQRISLEKRISELTGQVDQGQQFDPFTPQYQPGQEVSPEQLSNDVAKTANAIVELRLKQSEAVNRINNESRDVVRKYSQLDPESTEFDQELSDTVYEATNAYIRQNPYSASVTKFVDKLMKPYQRAIQKEAGKASENIAKQVSQAALRPTSVRKPEKSASEKTIEELEAELGIVQA